MKWWPIDWGNTHTRKREDGHKMDSGGKEQSEVWKNLDVWLVRYCEGRLQHGELPPKMKAVDVRVLEGSG